MRRVMEQEETCGRWCSLHMLITGYVHYGLPGDTTGWFLIGTMRIMVPQAMRKIRNCDHKPSMLAPSFGMGSGSTIWPPVSCTINVDRVPGLGCGEWCCKGACRERLGVVGSDTSVVAHRTLAEQYFLITPEDLERCWSEHEVECLRTSGHMHPECLLRTKLTVSYTHLRAHETPEHLVCRLLLEKKKKKKLSKLYKLI
eukprot:TRINITY_DN6577_c0_g1_i3.p1 TRINITY_DN6577_c0_g1~~TRINITY_DN6577_c0_g1_i3.p1  ORF type:complete len:199 (-),score=24.34 TRINITY_DN6577_c0_g1_i3:70-666(-)